MKILSLTLNGRMGLYAQFAVILIIIKLAEEIFTYINARIVAIKPLLLKILSWKIAAETSLYVDKIKAFLSLAPTIISEKGLPVPPEIGMVPLYYNL